MPRPTDAQISAAVQAFIDEHEFDKDDPPSMKAVEYFAEDSGFKLNRILYQFRQRGFLIPTDEAQQPHSPAGVIQPPIEDHVPMVTPIERAAEFAKVEFAKMTEVPSYEWLEAASRKLGIKYPVLAAAFVNENNARKSMKVTWP